MQEETLFYGAELLPLSVEKSGFLTSFTREATDDNRKEVEDIQSYLVIVSKIPNYETLNVKVLWTAFQLLSRVEEREKQNLLDKSESMYNLLYEENYAQVLISKLLPAKSKEDNGAQINNLRIKLKAQVASYVRLILLTNNV